MPLTAARILVVDDNLNGLHALAMLLRLEGYDVTTAARASEALDIAREQRPQLIILDVAMPGMSGVELAAELRKIPELRNTRIIAYSGYVTEKVRRAAMDAGCELFIEKPATPQRLQYIVHKFVNQTQPCVLFVDDNQAKRYACCTALRKEGIAVIEANSGHHALEVIETADPELILADAHLGDMDGYELCTRTKQLKDVPVVLVSVSPIDSHKAEATGINGYIDKYDDPQEFVRHVRGALRFNAPADS